ncbi:putative disease resistance RPP13-like protein 1 [Abrus precatorius]|uniref:Disease resistance RPP13-like protein 1 n=1 Tax=Abrus precatorius TaxID=3816 RepID=A0A8B8LKV9_ABRPR|nr:putative disease resistance RPP13-like protein 1 [Abrus precatorius]
MAEGLIAQPKSAWRMEDVGNKYINELLSRSFLQVEKKKDCFVMPDLLHDLAQYVAGEFTCTLEDDLQQKVSAKTRYVSFPGNKNVIAGRLDDSTELVQLRTFLFCKSSVIHLSSTTEELFNVSELLPKLKRLRALSLSCYHMDRMTDSIGKPKYLRYLDLSYTSITQLPYDVGSLYNLETLLLSHCSRLKDLPSNLCKLVNLRCLDINGTKLSEMPLNFNELKALQVLTDFFIGRDSGSQVSELGELSELHGSLTLTNLQNVIDAADASLTNLKSKKYLVKLQFKWTTVNHDIQNETDVLHLLQPHEYLKKLIIKNFGGSLPIWLGNSLLSNLVFLNLID